MQNIFSSTAVSFFVYTIAAHSQSIIGEHDFAGMFVEYADEVVDQPAQRAGEVLQMLELPGPVTVWRTESENVINFVAVDQSSGGAVICALLIVAQVQKKMDNCENFGTLEQVRTVDGFIDRIGVFVAKNSYPNFTFEEFQERWSLFRDERRKPPQQCPDINPDIDTLLTTILSEEFATELDLTLEVPRLPLIRPCF